MLDQVRPGAEQQKSGNLEGIQDQVTAPVEQEPKLESQPDNKPDVDESGWDEKTTNYIKSLRSESAKYRTESKDLKSKYDDMQERFGQLEGGLKQALGIEDDSELSPEEVFKEQNQVIGNLEMKLAVRDLAMESGIQGTEGVDYLEFLIQKAADSMDENDEIDEEVMTGLINQVKSAFPGGQQLGSTSVNSDNGTKQPTGGVGDVTLDQFAKMNVSEKSTVYQKNPGLYTSLMQQAKEKKLIT